MNRIILIFACIVAFSTSTYADILCGATISSPGEYNLESSKDCDAGWLTVSADNVTINGGGYTITYGNVSLEDGIQISDGHSGLTISNLIITQATNGKHGIDANNADIDGSEITDVTFNISTNTASDYAAIYSSYGSAIDIDWHDNTFNINTSGSAYAIFLNGGSVGYVTGNIYSNIFNLGSNLNSGRPSAFRATGYSGQYGEEPAFHNNTITISGTTTTGWLGWATDYWKIYSNSITLDSDSDNSKGIQFDGGSDYNQAFLNTITVASTGISSASYGIRCRFASSHNIIRQNTIDTSTATGAYKSYCISMGADQVTAPSEIPSNNSIYENILNGSGSNIPIQIYEDLENSEFYCNNITNATGSGVTTYSGGAISNVAFRNNTYTIGGGYDSVIITGSYSIDTMTFCKEYINESLMIADDILDSGEIGGWSINNSICGTCSPFNFGQGITTIGGVSCCQ